MCGFVPVVCPSASFVATVWRTLWPLLPPQYCYLRCSYARKLRAWQQTKLKTVVWRKQKQKDRIEMKSFFLSRNRAPWGFGNSIWSCFKLNTATWAGVIRKTNIIIKDSRRKPQLLLVYLSLYTVAVTFSPGQEARLCCHVHPSFCVSFLSSK